METTVSNLDFFALIRQGAISTYPLIACSIIMVAVALERIWSLRGVVSSTVALTAELLPLLARGDFAAARTAVERHRQCPARRVYGDLLAVPGDTPLVMAVECIDF